jgi:hypothetical protein
MTFAHSEKLTPSTPPETAMAAPVSPAIRAWDSEVGMPKIQAPTPQATMPTVAAARAMSAAWVSPPKSTISDIVSATAVEIMVMATKPTKLQATDMAMACSTVIERVPTGSAIAFAASVAPFTKMVPRTRMITRARKGLAETMPRNCEKVIKGCLHRLRLSAPI